MKTNKPRIIDLFAGIGGIRIGFESQGCEVVFTSEWDSAAQATYELNYGVKPHGDITQIACRLSMSTIFTSRLKEGLGRHTWHLIF
jgi:site-specific DNA-cytosine methylase